jgi:hypothetical protein
MRCVIPSSVLKLGKLRLDSKRPLFQAVSGHVDQDQEFLGRMIGLESVGYCSTIAVCIRLGMCMEYHSDF